MRGLIIAVNIVFWALCLAQAAQADDLGENRADVAEQIQETLHDGSIWVVTGDDNTTLLAYYTDLPAKLKMQNPQPNTPQEEAWETLRNGVGGWVYSLFCITDAQEHGSCYRLRGFDPAVELGAGDYNPKERTSIANAFSAAQRISSAPAVAIAVPVDDATKARWLRFGESCYLGEPEAASGCTAKNYPKAYRWFKKAANQGNEKAMWYLGQMYSFGHGVPQDYGLALDWYTKAAEKGNTDAQFVLGQMYYRALGVSQDYAKAFQWWGKASAQGDAEAQSNLGVMYEEGQAVPQNYTKAVELYTKSAEAGNLYGQFNLGKMYENGRGVKKDIATACDWYEKAAAQGHKGAAERLATLPASSPVVLRKQFADDLTRRMSNEICWCAGGKNGELLAGYITTSQFSPGTSSLIGTSSPLYRQLYHEGFRFVGLFDRDQSTKTAALTPNGAAPASITAITDLDRVYLDQAINVLMHVANGVDESSYRRMEGGKAVTECIPAKTPDSCPSGQVRRFMPSVGYVCMPQQ